jgi:DNA-binding transcriptional LysR family regulator
VSFTLRQFQVFEAAARHLNFTRASEELFMSQPAVSMQIRQLEEEVGLPLFEQIGKRMYLTDAGREIHRASREIARELQELHAVLDELKGLKGGRLEISVVSTANAFATWLLAIFSRRHQQVGVSLDVTNRKGLIRQLEANERDLILMGQPPEGLHVEVVPFMENPLVVVASCTHPLAGRERVSLQRLQDETFVIREQGSGTRMAMEKFFSDRSMTLRTGMELSSNEAIKQAVEAGLGLAVVSMHTVRVELEARRLAVLDVEDFPIIRHWHIVHGKGKRLSPAARAFKQFVLEEADGLFNERGFASAWQPSSPATANPAASTGEKPSVG